MDKMDSNVIRIGSKYIFVEAFRPVFLFPVICPKIPIFNSFSIVISFLNRISINIVYIDEIERSIFVSPQILAIILIFLFRKELHHENEI